MRKLNSKDPTAKLLYRKLIDSNQNLKQKLENNSEYKKGHIILPKISVDIDTNGNDIYSKDYNTVHFLGYIKDNSEPTQFQAQDTIKPCWLDLFDAWCKCDTKLYRHTIYDFWNNDYKYTINNKHKTEQEFIESLVIISIDFQMATYDNLYVSGNKIAIFTSQEALRVIAYALNFNEEEILGKTGTCSHEGTRYGWFASYADTQFGHIVTVVFLEGGRPTFGPKAAEISGKFYRGLYDHNFFRQPSTAASRTAGEKTAVGLQQ